MKRKRKFEAAYRGVLQQIEAAARSTYVDGIHRLGDANTATPHFTAIVECFETWVFTSGLNPDYVTIDYGSESCLFFLNQHFMGVKRGTLYYQFPMSAVLAYDFKGAFDDLKEVLGDLIIN